MDSNYSTEEYQCKKCKDTGWILYWEDGYEFARKCPDCAGKFRELDDTGIPPQFAGVDISKFNFGAYGTDMSKFRELVMDFIHDYPEWEKNGMGLYFSSETPGSGKTFLACCIARSVMVKYDIQMRFITVTDYLSAVGDSYKRQTGEMDKSKVYRICPLLVLDDLGAQKTGSWQDQELFRLINSRIMNGLMTIYTSNFTQKSLVLGDRTIDRIIASSVPLAMPEVSIRRREAEAKQKRIIESIMKK